MVEHVGARDYILADRAYDFLKPIVLIVAPAVSALYLVLGNSWGWPNPEAIAATITSISTFVGVLLTLASRSYNKSESKFDGVLALEKQDDETVALDLTGLPAPEDLGNMSQITLKVQ